jgi:hypothetical protein
VENQKKKKKKEGLLIHGFELKRSRFDIIWYFFLVEFLTAYIMEGREKKRQLGENALPIN